MNSKETKGLYWVSGITLVIVIGMLILQLCRPSRSSNELPATHNPFPYRPSHTFTVSPSSTTSIVTSAIANQEIQLYLNNAWRYSSWVNNSFIIGDKSNASDFNTLKSYISANTNIGDLHVIIGKDVSMPSKGETILLCGLDNFGNHQYINLQSQTVNNVYSAIEYSFCTQSPGLAVTTAYPMAAATLNVVPTSTLNVTASAIPSCSGNLLSADIAQNFINSYFNFGGKNAQKISSSAYSFVIPSNALNDYIQAASPAIVGLQFYLGLSTTERLELMIIGVDASGNKIFINNNNKNCVLEEFIPCPVCNVVGNSPSDIANPVPNQSFLFE
jgi:hypothetical protein